MRKIWLILIIIFGILLLLFATFIFLVYHQPGYSYINSSLVNKYPALSLVKDPALPYPKFRRVYNGFPFETKSNITISSDGKTLYYDSQKKVFSCNGNSVNLITYSSESPGSGYIGGWASNYIIDCKDVYWVYSSSDPIPFSVSGPFLFNESASFLEQSLS